MSLRTSALRSKPLRYVVVKIGPVLDRRQQFSSGCYSKPEGFSASELANGKCLGNSFAVVKSDIRLPEAHWLSECFVKMDSRHAA